jgi:hypothetical protein
MIEKQMRCLVLALKNTDIRSRAGIAVVLIGLVAAVVSVMVYGAFKNTRIQLANSYWENARQARAAGDELLGLHYIAKAVEMADDKKLATAIRQDAGLIVPHYSVVELYAHKDAVRGAAFSKDGKRILTWSDDRTAQVWDATTGIKKGWSLIHSGKIKGAVFSKDERRILTWSSDSTARLWNAATGEQLGASFKHEASVNEAVFSRDETKILTWGWDKTVRLWDAASGKQLGAELAHNGTVRIAVFSKDEKRLLTWTDSPVRMWDAATGKKVGLTLPPVDKGIRHCFPTIEHEYLPGAGTNLSDCGTG